MPYFSNNPQGISKGIDYFWTFKNNHFKVFRIFYIQLLGKQSAMLIFSAKVSCNGSLL